MLFDIVSTIEATASAALVATTLCFALATTSQRRIRIASMLAAWFVAVVVLGATLALDAKAGVGTIGLGIASALPIVAICFAFFTVPAVRAALFAIPLPALVAVNVLRVLGASFVLLYAAHRLPAPFALSAGLGDIFVGLTALPIAWLVARHGARAAGPVIAWNAIGVVDLIAALFLGATSSAGPIQIFTASPDTSLMVSLPWILIPCFLVPMFLSMHIAIFYRLSRIGFVSIASNDRSTPISLAPGPTSPHATPDERSIGFIGRIYRMFEHLSA
jgi:hypothetical protein